MAGRPWERAGVPRCLIGGPDGAVCERHRGHATDHKQGPTRWPNPAPLPDVGGH